MNSWTADRKLSPPVIANQHHAPGQQWYYNNSEEEISGISVALADQPYDACSIGHENGNCHEPN
ncbi:MAG: hypothetical protein R3F50_10100 [Gammaproteobacteria bacterium]